MNNYLSNSEISILWLVGCYGVIRIAWAIYRWRKFLRGLRNQLMLSLFSIAVGFAAFKALAPAIGHYFPDWFAFLTLLSALGNAFLPVVVGEILNTIVRRSFRLTEENQLKTIEVSSLIAYADQGFERNSAILKESRKIHASR